MVCVFETTAHAQKMCTGLSAREDDLARSFLILRSSTLMANSNAAVPTLYILYTDWILKCRTWTVLRLHFESVTTILM